MTHHPIPDAALDEDIAILGRKGGGKLAPARPCAYCSTTFSPPWKQRQQRFCSRRCWLKSNHTPEHQRAAAVARNIKSRGTGTKYPYVKRDGRHEHRIVAEEKLGRPLLPGEVVHHRDENGRNNDPNNLQPLPNQREHAILHFTGKKHSQEHVAKRMATRAATMRERGYWK